MRVIARLANDLVALRSTAGSERHRIGQLLQVGDAPAAVLCARGGALLASLLPSRCGGVLPPTVSEGMEATVLKGEMLRAPLGSGSLLGGRIVDGLGNALDGGPPITAPDAAVFFTPAAQSELKPINRSLHSGTLAIDALTPIGRGQSMMIFGEDGTGKSTIGWDAVLAQAQSDVHCVIALSSGGVERARRALERLRELGHSDLLSRTTVVASPRPDPSSAECMLMLASAAAVGEAVRDAGGHALVVADDLRALGELWEAAGTAVAHMGGPSVGAASDKMHNSEQRIFFASWLQRASQMIDSLGGGSLTLLATMRQLPRPAAADATGAACSARAFELKDFASHPKPTQARLAALVARGVALEPKVLRALGIEPPALKTATPLGAADLEAREAHRRTVLHIDQLMSLADGHLSLRRSLFEEGRRPAVLPGEAIARVGAGSEQGAGRATPTTPAMKRVANALRLELAQAHDLLPPDASDSVAVRQQRLRARAFEAVLCGQPKGTPYRLAHQLLLLHCLLRGHLDHLGEGGAGDAAAGKAEAAGGAADGATRVHRAVREVLSHVDRRMGDAVLSQIDATGVLEGPVEEAMMACAAEVLPRATGRAFFTNWDANYAYDTSKATPVALKHSGSTSVVVEELIRGRESE
jgi:F-type H+-transporting ATPase subunit alpha